MARLLLRMPLISSSGSRLGPRITDLDFFANVNPFYIPIIMGVEAPGSRITVPLNPSAKIYAKIYNRGLINLGGVATEIQQQLVMVTHELDFSTGADDRSITLLSKFSSGLPLNPTNAPTVQFFSHDIFPDQDIDWFGSNNNTTCQGTDLQAEVFWSDATVVDPPIIVTVIVEGMASPGGYQVRSVTESGLDVAAVMTPVSRHGNSFVNTGREYAVFKNGGQFPVTVRVNPADLTISNPNHSFVVRETAGHVMVGPFPPRDYNNDLGQVVFEYGGAPNPQQNLTFAICRTSSFA